MTLLRNVLRSLNKQNTFLYVRNMTSNSVNKYSFETLKVTNPSEYVISVEVNRPNKRNAMNKLFYEEMQTCFKEIKTDPDCRAVVLSGAGKTFSAGIDIMDLAGDILQGGDEDAARRSMKIRGIVSNLQESFNVIEKCNKPVISAIHGGCIGGGVDMVCACDIRYAVQDAYFQIKEVDIGLAADLGTLQRLPKIVGNDSLVRELVYTARKLYADDAKSFGLVSRVFQSKEEMMESAINLAAEIASKSPVAVVGSKVNLLYSRDHGVYEALEYITTWNQSMLQSSEPLIAATASMSKEKPIFSKL